MHARTHQMSLFSAEVVFNNPFVCEKLFYCHDEIFYMPKKLIYFSLSYRFLSFPLIDYYLLFYSPLLKYFFYFQFLSPSRFPSQPISISSNNIKSRPTFEFITNYCFLFVKVLCSDEFCVFQLRVKDIVFDEVFELLIAWHLASGSRMREYAGENAEKRLKGSHLMFVIDALNQKYLEVGNGADASNPLHCKADHVDSDADCRVSKIIYHAFYSLGTTFNSVLAGAYLALAISTDDEK